MAVGVAVIGVGAPWHHLPALSHMKEAAVVAVCDIDESRLAAAAQAYGISAAYTDYRAMLDRVGPQAVYVLPSVLSTVEIATQCLDRGLHVFVEKPPGLRAEETRALARLARERGVISMVGFNRRFHPLVAAARAVAGAGRPSAVIAEWFKPLLMDDMGQTFQPAVLERLLAVTTIHSVDLLRFLGGEVDDVQAVAERSYSPYVDAVHALLRFRGGGIGVLLSDYHTTKLERLSIHGRGLLIELTGAGAPYREGRIFKDNRWSALLAPPGERTDPDGFFEEDRHFIARVGAGQPVTPEGADLDDAVRTMELAEAIVAAARVR
ncbi:MAG: Gfo/Idh/MocA family protein [Armatimonadota bacterium]